MENSGLQFARAFSAKLRIPTGLIHQKVSPPTFFTIRYIVLPNLFCNVQRMLYGFQSWDNVVEACQQLLLQWKEKALHGKFLKKVSSIGELTYIATYYSIHTML